MTITRHYRRAIRVAVLSATLFAAAGPIGAQDDFKANVDPSLHIRRAAGNIKVDGHLSDPGWQGMAVADNFCETSPGNNAKPPVETRAYLTYDDNNLYVAIVANDNPGDIRASLCERDRTPGDDNLGFHIDTYGDADWGYVFFVNRHGVQYDALWTSDFGWDTKYDLIWESAGQLTDSGFQVEFSIPLAGFRFPDRPQQTWKVNFVRYHERDVTHYLSWTAEDRNDPCELCQLGAVTGVENIKPGRGIEIIPAVTGFQSGSLVGNSDGTLNFDNLDPDGDLSLSAKYSISSSATAEFAVNPDFSQVEADANQIDVNSTTALSFPEKRPFFQEGSDLFRSSFEIVDTRSINDPIFATKATARLGRTSLAYLGAYDEHSPVVVPFDEFSSDPIDVGKSISNIIRLRQSFGENSRLGILATDRRYDGGGAGSAIGMDGYFRLSRSIGLSLQAIATHTDEPNDTLLTQDIEKYNFIDDSLVVTPAADYRFDDEHSAAFDGESFWGHGFVGELHYSPRDFSAGLGFSATSPTFRLDNGYEPKNSEREAGLESSYIFRFDDGLITSLNPQIAASWLWNDGGSLKREEAAVGLQSAFRWNQTYLHQQFQTASEFYADKQFDHLWTFHQCFSSAPSNQISFSGGINYGNSIARRDRVVGRETMCWLGLDFQPVDQMLISSSYDWVQSRSVETDEMLYKGYQVRSRLNYQFSRELSLRCVVQYSDFSEHWDIDPLLTYRINPFTLFYVGTTHDYQNYYGLNREGTAFVAEGEDRYKHNRLQSRQFFMKLQYLFQI